MIYDVFLRMLEKDCLKRITSSELLDELGNNKYLLIVNHYIVK